MRRRILRRIVDVAILGLVGVAICQGLGAIKWAVGETPTAIATLAWLRCVLSSSLSA